MRTALHACAVLSVLIVSSLNAAALLSAWEEGVSQPLIGRALALLEHARPDRSAKQWAQASIGERDEQLLDLREELFGSDFQATAVCPSCGERLELTFSAADIRASAGRLTGRDEKLHVKAFGYEVSCRLPTSADLLEIATARTDDGRQMLLKLCVEAAQAGGLAVDSEALPDEVVNALSEEMSRVDPQADVHISLACPACLHGWNIVFDILSYFWSEIEDWAQRLLLEVHLLASAYGWSERDIISMSATRRRLYLDMIGA